MSSFPSLSLPDAAAGSEGDANVARHLLLCPTSTSPTVGTPSSPYPVTRRRRIGRPALLLIVVHRPHPLLATKLAAGGAHATSAFHCPSLPL